MLIAPVNGTKKLQRRLSKVHTEAFTAISMEMLLVDSFYPQRHHRLGLLVTRVKSGIVIATLTCMYAYKGCLSEEDVFLDKVSLVKRFFNIMRIGNVR